MIMSHYFFYWLVLEARADMQKKSFVFWFKRNFEICFWNLLTFIKNENRYDLLTFKYLCNVQYKQMILFFFCSNENNKICFWNLLTFSIEEMNTLTWSYFQEPFYFTDQKTFSSGIMDTILFLKEWL